MDRLNIGNTAKGRPFKLDLDAAVQKFAIMGISGSGKSCTAAVLAEEMCENALPWIALDPVSVWWGLRASRDGKPGGYPVVVFGGDHGDLPIEKGSGAKIAEALVAENVFAVIDLSLESKRFWHQFVTDFCLTLMQLNPETPRHIFVEEAPEFVPQKTKVDLTARCREAMERLIRLGRNRGYGYSLISQRPATVDKDCLSQTENLLVLRTVGAHDRKALKEWLDVQGGRDNVSPGLDGLQKLDNGEAYFWSPQWLKDFTKVKIRERKTFHPGETRKIGKKTKPVALRDVKEFVSRLRPQLTKTVARVPAPAKPYRGLDDIATEQISRARNWTPEDMRDKNLGLARLTKENNALRQTIEDLKKRLSDASRKAQDSLRRLESVRQSLKPQYDSLRALFEDLGPSNGATVDASVYQPWIEKAGNGKRRRMLEVVIDRQELTRAQLSTLSGTSINSSGFKNSLSWMRTNRLVNVEGDVVRLCEV